MQNLNQNVMLRAYNNTTSELGVGRGARSQRGVTFIGVFL